MCCLESAAFLASNSLAAEATVDLLVLFLLGVVLSQLEAPQLQSLQPLLIKGLVLLVLLTGLASRVLLDFRSVDCELACLILFICNIFL